MDWLDCCKRLARPCTGCSIAVIYAQIPSRKFALREVEVVDKANTSAFVKVTSGVGVRSEEGAVAMLGYLNLDRFRCKSC